MTAERHRPGKSVHRSMHLGPVVYRILSISPRALQNRQTSETPASGAAGTWPLREVRGASQTVGAQWFWPPTCVGGSSRSRQSSRRKAPEKAFTASVIVQATYPIWISVETWNANRRRPQGRRSGTREQQNRIEGRPCPSGLWHGDLANGCQTRETPASAICTAVDQHVGPTRVAGALPWSADALRCPKTKIQPSLPQQWAHISV